MEDEDADVCPVERSLALGEELVVDVVPVVRAPLVRAVAEVRRLAVGALVAADGEGGRGEEARREGQGDEGLVEVHVVVLVFFCSCFLTS